jgi:hypothetical protein
MILMNESENFLLEKISFSNLVLNYFMKFLNVYRFEKSVEK